MTVRTVVLDDDPTGSQSVEGVPVALEFEPDRLRSLLRDHPGFFAITNTRAMDEERAVALLGRLKADIETTAAELGVAVRFVLRGDSTLRGHVFAEIGVFEGADGVVLLAPAFPGGGRLTEDGVHLVRTADRWLNAADTEFAQDPVFGFRERSLREYVAARAPGRPFRSVKPADVEDALVSALPGTIVAPDTKNDADIATIHAGLTAARNRGRDVTVRCAAPLAALEIGSPSRGLLSRDGLGVTGSVLVVCGSHTRAASEQLAELGPLTGEPVTLPTALAMADGAEAARWAAAQIMDRLDRAPVAVLSTERIRRAEHGTVIDGEQVMTALTATVALVRPRLGAVIAKGGITSAEVARTGLGVGVARVRGQLLPGVSLWDVELADGRALPYVVVPGNIGSPSTLLDLVTALRPQPTDMITKKPQPTNGQLNAFL